MKYWEISRNTYINIKKKNWDSENTLIYRVHLKQMEKIPTAWSG